MKSATLTLMLAAWGVSVCQTAIADQAADEAAIREAVDVYVAAFNRGDAAALSAMWSPEAVYINPVSGEQAVGRQAIEEQFAAIFADSTEGKLSATTDSVQFVSPNVAIENGTAVVARPDGASDETQYAAVYIKRDGKWLLDRVTEKEAPVLRSNYEHLKELEWMIGTWVDGDDEAQVETTCRWTKNRNFITRMYSLTVDDRIEVSGMQVVGWDPAAEQIRSWVFDSDGGFGEGTWTKKGAAWQIHNTGVAPDGSKSSSLNIITYVDANAFTWQSIDREAGGELLPNVDEVVVVRQPSAAE